MNCLKIIAAGAVFAFATLAPATAAEFREVDVSIQLNADSSNALGFWPSIEPDMEAVMKQRISTIFNPNGLHVTVSLDTVSNDGSGTLADSGEFNTLGGLALVRKEPNGPVVNVVEFSVTALPWQLGIEDGMFVLNDKADFYTAMLNHFADEMVTQIGD